MDANTFLGPKRIKDETLEDLGVCVKTARSRQEVDEAAMQMIREAHKEPDAELRRQMIQKAQKWAEEHKQGLSAREMLKRDMDRITPTPE